ncbi:methyltransferase domain-containing protein [archaeon]|nr:methyltransferase domain-containing protein [archaeon]
MKNTPIEAQKTVELIECGIEKVREAKILELNTSAIEFDRFMRINAVAECVNKLKLKKDTLILDVGGFDGAFALFVPELKVWVIDPQTTGGSGLSIPFPDKHFEVVVSIDALEHLPREDRPKLLQELIRVTRTKLFVNFPEARSTNAQKAVLSTISNKFIQEHVNYQLPTREETTSFLKKISPNIKITALSHVNIYSWLAWFVLFHTDKQRGLQVSKFLKQNANESTPPFLYDLLSCEVEEKK